MPGPGAAPVAAAAGSGPAAITGSVPDVTSMALGLSAAMAPDKGFAYNLCTFRINLSEPDQAQQPTRQNASLGTPSRASSGASSATMGVTNQAPKWRQTFENGFFAVLNEKKPVVEVKVHCIAAGSWSAPSSLIGVVVLARLDGFDTAIGHNLAVEVSAVEQTAVPHGVVLAIKGMINPAGEGFAHFVGASFMRAVIGEAPGPYFKPEPIFIRHADSKGGLFRLPGGKKISTEIDEYRLVIRID